MIDIVKNISDVRERIKNAALRSGRNPEDVKLIAVTKTVDVPQLLSAYEGANQICFGENRVQELMRKQEVLEAHKEIKDNIEWHLIGHLQTNKVKYIIDKVSLIHSVDSVALIEELEKQACKKACNASFLLQVNVSKEDTKYGVSLDEVRYIVTKMSQYRNITLKGFMTMAPYVTEPEKARSVFKDLYNMYIDLSYEKTHNVCMKYLSMGMSNDFEVAVEEGANLVRLGTSIFTKVKKGI